MQFTYETIKQMAKEENWSVVDLIALAPQNDPFYTGRKGDKLLGTWFADLWRRFGYGYGIHIRRVHYQIVSQDPPILFPNGKPYENTESCWKMLCQASKVARYLELVNPSAFVDRRNPTPLVYLPDRPVYGPSISVENNDWDVVELPSFPSLPIYDVENYTTVQPYHLEIWCEKSTMNDILVPLVKEYRINLVTGVGELSTTATLSAVCRFMQSERPARILYVSDFDPAGQCMPVSAARKIEYFIRNHHLDLDVRLFPIVLTAEQASAYALPRTPIKDTELRRDSFEALHGEGATELDALEALYPGELRRILEDIIEHYHDPDLDKRISEAEEELEETLEDIRQGILQQHQQEIDTLEAEYDQICRDFNSRIEDFSARLEKLRQAIQNELEEAKPKMRDYPIPKARAADEIGEGLYNSDRGYFDQIGMYKAFQGKAT